MVNDLESHLEFEIRAVLGPDAPIRVESLASGAIAITIESPEGAIVIDGAASGGQWGIATIAPDVADFSGYDEVFASFAEAVQAVAELFHSGK